MKLINSFRGVNELFAAFLFSYEAAKRRSVHVITWDGGGGGEKRKVGSDLLKPRRCSFHVQSDGGEEEEGLNLRNGEDAQNASQRSECAAPARTSRTSRTPPDSCSFIFSPRWGQSPWICLDNPAFCAFLTFFVICTFCGVLFPADCCFYARSLSLSLLSFGAPGPWSDPEEVQSLIMYSPICLTQVFLSVSELGRCAKKK